MNLEYYLKLTQSFCEARDWDRFHSPKELAIGLSTEANELLAIFRFLDQQQTQQALLTHQEAIADEVADVFFFLLRFVQLHQIDLEQAFLKKLAKNEIKYPVSLVKGKNLKYNQYK